MGVGLKPNERCPFGLLTRLAKYGGAWTGCNGLGFAIGCPQILDSKMGY